jgi:FMN reductase
MTRPYIVGLGGTTRAGSSTQMALSLMLESVRQQGADTLLLSGPDLDLPAYMPGAEMLAARAQRILGEIRRADGIMLGTPGYHGGISGLVKNALDYTEELKGDRRPYLEGRAVGCVVTAAGAQGAMTTLIALRSVVHALRGWPTPLGVAIVTSNPVFDAVGNCLSSGVETQLKLVAQQVLDFAVSQMKSVSSVRSACRTGGALEQIA